MKELFILLSACAILQFVVLHCVVMFHLVSFHSNIYYKLKVSREVDISRARSGNDIFTDD